MLRPRSLETQRLEAGAKSWGTNSFANKNDPASSHTEVGYELCDHPCHSFYFTSFYIPFAASGRQSC